MFALFLFASGILQTAHVPVHHPRHVHHVHVDHGGKERISMNKRAWALAGFGSAQ